MKYDVIKICCRPDVGQMSLYFQEKHEFSLLNHTDALILLNISVRRASCHVDLK